MITPAQRAEIRRLSFGEHWKIGTIAAALGVHHETVRAALVRIPDDREHRFQSNVNTDSGHVEQRFQDGEHGFRGT